MTNPTSATLILAIQRRAERATSLIERDSSLLKGDKFPAPLAGISPDIG
jgi:hypothetical protein